MIDNITYSVPVGRSDHLVMEWNLTCYAEPVATRVAKYRYDEANDIQAEMEKINC